MIPIKHRLTGKLISTGTTKHFYHTSLIKSRIAILHSQFEQSGVIGKLNSDLDLKSFKLLNQSSSIVMHSHILHSIAMTDFKMQDILAFVEDALSKNSWIDLKSDEFSFHDVNQLISFISSSDSLKLFQFKIIATMMVSAVFLNSLQTRIKNWIDVQLEASASFKKPIFSRIDVTAFIHQDCPTMHNDLCRDIHVYIENCLQFYEKSARAVASAAGLIPVQDQLNAWRKLSDSMAEQYVIFGMYLDGLDAFKGDEGLRDDLVAYARQSCGKEMMRLIVLHIHIESGTDIKQLQTSNRLKTSAECTELTQRLKSEKIILIQRLEIGLQKSPLDEFRTMCGHYIDSCYITMPPIEELKVKYLQMYKRKLETVTDASTALHLAMLCTHLVEEGSMLDMPGKLIPRILKVCTGPNMQLLRELQIDIMDGLKSKDLNHGKVVKSILNIVAPSPSDSVIFKES